MNVSVHALDTQVHSPILSVLSQVRPCCLSWVLSVIVLAAYAYLPAGFTDVSKGIAQLYYVELPVNDILSLSHGFFLLS